MPGVTPKVYPVGYQHLTGWEAVDYLRQRHVRQFLAALFKPVTAAETGLMTALAHDDLAAWVAAHPDAVTRQ